jgi:hypothetical protein
MLIPLLTLALSLPVVEPLPPDMLGSGLYRNCKADIRTMDSPDKVDRTDEDPADACIHYVSGFVEAFTMAHEICPTEEPSTGTVIRLYVAYMDKYPKLFDEHRAFGLRAALIDAYSCAPK